MKMVLLSTIQAATVLAALRHWQVSDMPAESYPDHFEGLKPLNDHEVDALCEAINCTDTLKLTDNEQRVLDALPKGDTPFVVTGLYRYGDQEYDLMVQGYSYDPEEDEDGYYPFTTSLRIAYLNNCATGQSYTDMVAAVSASMLSEMGDGSVGEGLTPEKVDILFNQAIEHNGIGSTH